MSIIKIKRSSSAGAPSALGQGELAYSYLSGTEVNGGDRLYIGTGTETNGEAANIEVVGGKYFTQKLDHTPGTLTANSAIITDANNAIDKIFIDKISIDDATIGINSNTSYAAANSNLTITAGSLGTIILSSPTSFTANTIDFDGQVTISSLNVEDLTNNRIVIAGSLGELEDDANFTFDGTTFRVGNTSVKADITVASGNFDTTGRVEADGTLGADGNFRIGVGGANKFTIDATNGNTLTTGTVGIDGNTAIGANTSSRVWTINSATGQIDHYGTGNVTGQWNVDNLRLDGNTMSSENTDGNINLDPNGTGYVQVVGTNGLVIPVGNTGQQGPAVQGAIRYNSEINQFEGYSGTNWSSMGGVRSVDGLTYIIAESSPANSDDTLHFYAATSNTATNKVATLDDVSLTILNGTASSNTSTGSLVVQGGAGISGAVNIGGSVDIDGDLNVDGGDITTNVTTFNLINTNATTVNAFGAATAVNFGASTGVTTISHSLTSTGNFKVAANAFFVNATTGDTLVGRDLTVTGNLTVGGNTTTINVETLQVEDALIYLAANNTTADSVDIGFAGNFFDATANSVMITGLMRDSGTKEWYIFDEYVDANINDNNIDITSNTFSKGVLNTDRVNFSNTTIALSGDVAGSITIDHFGGSSTSYSISTTIQSDSVALGTDTTGNYVASVGVTAGTGLNVTGTGEGAAVTLAGVDATNTVKGVASFSNTNFAVSSGAVTISAIDGGTY